jgi:hypothetical protein
MKRMVGRVIPATPASRIDTMSTQVLTLPKPHRPADAIVVLTGLGEDWRLTQSIETWENSPAARYFLIAGGFSEEETWFEPTLENLSAPPFRLCRHDGVIILPHAHDSVEQAQWVTSQFRKLGITSADLYVSPYYLVRAYCTILRSMLKAHSLVALTPVPVEMWPDTVIPETKVDSWEMGHGEFERKLKYQNKGDVATFEELRDYLTWLRTSPRYAPA